MDIGTCISKTMRDCGTQLRQPYLASHLQKFEVKSKAASSISEETLRVLLLAQPINRTLNKASQTGRYGPWDKQGNVRCQSIKTPSVERNGEPFLEPEPGPAPRSTPAVAKTVVLNSRNKRKYCTELLEEIKNQADFDNLFGRVGCSLEKRMAKNRPTE